MTAQLKTRFRGLTDAQKENVGSRLREFGFNTREKEVPYYNKGLHAIHNTTYDLTDVQPIPRAQLLVPAIEYGQSKIDRNETPAFVSRTEFTIIDRLKWLARIRDYELNSGPDLDPPSDPYSIQRIYNLISAIEEPWVMEICYTVQVPKALAAALRRVRELDVGFGFQGPSLFLDPARKVDDLLERLPTLDAAIKQLRYKPLGVNITLHADDVYTQLAEVLTQVIRVDPEIARAFEIVVFSNTEPDNSWSRLVAVVKKLEAEFPPKT